ncbi:MULTISPECIES: hypothetical protein [unclassified Rhodococcus (in: high G+C Gram-positive bacteria)]|uniref:hypothetical protein n=1 Tax=unclassified Rhodococcus (in: high G+C Gram-positive bacteria) TaxID=192944 RepID=UPI0015959EB9|nr:MULTISPECIES: hypothetical protein [unclassified Rhodococcus (in: high G+C Gram-positive bacteria)]
MKRGRYESDSWRSEYAWFKSFGWPDERIAKALRMPAATLQKKLEREKADA